MTGGILYMGLVIPPFDSASSYLPLAKHPATAKNLEFHFLPDRHHVAPGFFALVHQLICPVHQAVGRIS